MQVENNFNKLTISEEAIQPLPNLPEELILKIFQSSAHNLRNLLLLNTYWNQKHWENKNLKHFLANQPLCAFTQTNIPLIKNLNKEKILSSLIRLENTGQAIDPISILLLPKGWTMENLTEKNSTFKVMDYLKEFLRLTPSAKDTCLLVTRFKILGNENPKFRREVQDLGWMFASYLEAASWKASQQEMGNQIADIIFAETNADYEAIDEDVGYPFIKENNQVDDTEYAINPQYCPFMVKWEVEVNEETTVEQMDEAPSNHALKRPRNTEEEGETKTQKKMRYTGDSKEG